MTRRVAVALAALALAATACGTRVTEWPEGALEPTDYYTERGETTGSEESLSSTEDGGSSTNGNSSSGNASKAKDPNSSGAAPAATGDLPAPAPGTYTYDQSGDGEEPTSETISWAVERTTSSVTMTSTEKQDEGQFSVTTTSRYRVTPAALELLSTTTSFDDEDPETCTYKPVILVLKLPLETGEKWKVKSACQGERADEVEFSVTGTANDVIGGKAVKTFVVSLKQSFDSTDDTTGERTTFSFEDTRHVDPATLLTVIEDIAFSFDGEQSTVHRQLRSLTPT